MGQCRSSRRGHWEIGRGLPWRAWGLGSQILAQGDVDSLSCLPGTWNQEVPPDEQEGADAELLTLELNDADWLR